MPARRSMQGAVVVVALLCLVVGLVPAVYSVDEPHEGEMVALWPEPLTAIRGQSLRLNAWLPEDSDTDNCTLEIDNMPTMVPEIRTHQGQALSVVVWVPPTAPDSLQVSAKCNVTKLGSPVTVPVSWGLELLLSHTMTPNPANKDKLLCVSLNLTNSGPRPAFNVKCNFTTAPGAEGSDGSGSRVVLYPYLPASAINVQKFNWTKFSKDGSLRVSCTSFDKPLLEDRKIDLLLKEDAKIQIRSPLSKVTAGKSEMINTTVENSGSAKADNLNCTLSFDPSQVHYLKTYVDRCTPIMSAQNVTGSVLCPLGDMNSGASIVLPLEFRIDGSVIEGTEIDFKWVCKAQDLSEVKHDIKATAEVKASFDIEPKPDGYLTIDDPRAIHFKLKNPGPSDFDETNCTFTATGVSFEATANSSYYSCLDEKKADQLSLDCRIHNLPAGGGDFDLTLKVEDSSLPGVNITVECSFKKDGKLTHMFSVPIKQASPTPSAPPQIPQAPVPDNTMVVVVTVIVALGLLIVVVIWWRRKQDRAGWDESGLNGRRPSVNRFTDMELSVRSDD